MKEKIVGSKKFGQEISENRWKVKLVGDDTITLGEVKGNNIGRLYFIGKKESIKYIVL